MKHILTFEEFLNESKSSSKILYKFTFNDSYKKDGKTPDPVFVQLTEPERNKASKYAAIDKVGGYGEKNVDQLSSSIRGDVKEVSYTELMDIIKSLKK